MKKLIVLRRTSQIFFLAAVVYILWSASYPLRGFLKPDIIFKLDPLDMLSAMVSERVIMPGILLSIVMLAAGMIAGRFFCGWVCPLGTMIDCAGAFNKKKTILSDKANERLRRPKFFILGLITFSALIGIQAAWVLDPIGIFARFISLNFIPAVTNIINAGFIFLIRTFNLYGPVYDTYQSLKMSFLGVKGDYFSHAPLIFLFFAAVMASCFIVSRFWCRSLCPLGAMYAFFGRRPLLLRRIDECVKCGVCKSRCRMGAIRDDASYSPGECVLCMDCIYDCPKWITRFKWDLSRIKKRAIKKNKSDNGGSLSRRQFLLLIGTAFFTSGFGFGQKTPGSSGRNVIRPPGAGPETAFVNRCVRCGNCMKVCPTNCLHPVLFRSGAQGVWTPEVVPEIGQCEYNCNLCGTVCPTGAIPDMPLYEKQGTKLGIAQVHKDICIAWAQNKECVVCEEQCPIPSKAVKLKEETTNGVRVLKPYVDVDLCIGCGACQNKCPVRPARAIRVKPV